MKDKIAFITQRYGKALNTGTDTECRLYAEHLANIFNVEVLTTCAADFMTWEDYYPAGDFIENNVTIHRFSVNKNSNNFDEKVKSLTEKYNRSSTDFYNRAPFSPELVTYLEEHGNEYKAIFFMCYLADSTYYGIQCKNNAIKIIIPTAHRDNFIWQENYHKLFQIADKILYQSAAEKSLVEEVIPFTKEKPNLVVGMGMDYPAEILPDIHTKYNITDPYICYCGRVCYEKNCFALIKYFINYKKQYPSNLKLVITGQNFMFRLPENNPDIIYLGFVSDEEKYAVMKDSVALALASEWESLSIVVLESMMMGRPVLVNEKCQVLKDHCEISHAGLCFNSYEDFANKLQYLLNNTVEYHQMCINAPLYIKQYYNWDTVINQMKELATDDPSAIN